MARYKVEIANVNTANIKVLTNDEMLELFIKYKNGDKLAKEELVNGNLKLVLSILKKYNNRTDNMDDLFQIGCIGLIKAIENFDLSHEVKFSTYAVPMILGEVKRYLRDNSSIRIARSIKDIAYKALKLKEELSSDLGREPTTSELSKIMGLKEIEIGNAIDAMKDTVSMFEPIYNDGGDVIYLADQLSDNSNSMYDIDTKLSLKDAILKLKDKERDIINKRYFIGKTQMELSEELGISQAQISRIEKSALENIKKMSGKVNYAITGVTIKDLYQNKEISFTDVTEVYFKNVSDKDIAWYVENEKYLLNRAGYSIAGKTSIFVDKIVGDYYNILGMPISKLYSKLNELGYSISDFEMKS